MRDWSEALIAARKRIDSAQKALTLIDVGGGPGHDQNRRAEAETLLLYAIHDLQDAIGWARTR